MICTRCQGQNSDNVNFCVHCGAPLRSTCPNCGTVNTPGARFCISCGHAIGAAPPAPMVSPQPVVVVKQGTPGWAWAFIGILVGVIIIGGLGLSGILPLGFLETVTPTSLPTVKPVVPSTEILVSVEAYCPQEGGVILYWNAGYDCQSESGDPGYRQRLGDGVQNLNTGEFDDQASAISIPPGWSVRLYENPDRGGVSVCFNSSVPNFEDRGNFPDRGISINDNVSSMEVFADGTCGEDLAAGAEPAPLPKDVDLGYDAPALPNAGNDDSGCTDQAPCACLPDELKKLSQENPPFNGDHGSFSNSMLDTFDVNDATGVFVYELKRISNLEILLNTNLKLKLRLPVKRGDQVALEEFYPTCEMGRTTDNDPKLRCQVVPPAGAEILDPYVMDAPYDEERSQIREWYRDYSMRIQYESEAMTAVCFVDERPDPDEANEFAPSDPTPPSYSQCTNPHKPQVCGDQCCNKDDICVQRRGVWKCDRPPGPQSGCSASLGSLECSAAGGTWIDPPGSCSCP